MTGAAAASYEWAVSADGEEWSVVETETDETFDVTPDLAGMYVKVTVTAEDGEEASDVTDEPVGVYDKLEILSAEQKGEKEVEVTFSAPATASDKITVTKGGNSVEIKSAIDSDKLGAKLTFTDAITAGTYTVTLTPADTTVKASSVTFEGERAVLDKIVFLSKELVMKDHLYNEGYAYIEGRDQFNHKKSLSGLTVVSGVGTFKSYDNETGKITIKDDTVADDKTGAFLTIKEVPVFVQYQSGSTVVSANETLTVSTRAYLSDLEFGEIKKNGDARKDGRLTLAELRSGLYYVEVLSAKDQYGNALSAEDLEDQKEDHVLFVIPGDTGAFYNTGKFGALNGKTVLWLEGDVDSKPGTMDLTVTGAGGATFKKEAVTIDDNPYIDALVVDYPDLYEGMTKSAKLNFSAVDQYGEDINLWDFKPIAGDLTTGNVGGSDILTFGDGNSMTQRGTEIKISGGATFNTVEYDTKAKEFVVDVNVGTMEAKQMAVFTVTTAGTQVSTQTITIGERGGAATIASSFPATKKLAPGGDWNINSDIEFVDNNGNTMTRYKNNTLYPYFVDGDVIKANVTNDSLKNDEKPTKYLWTVSDVKIKNAAAAQDAHTTFDEEGKITEAEIGGGDAKDFYVTVFGEYGGKYYILDDATVRVSTTVATEKKVEVVAPSTLYAATNSRHSVGFKVKITNHVGDTYDVDASGVSVGGIFAGNVTGNSVSGKIASNLPGNTTKTTPVSVYHDNDLVGTTTLTYTNVEPVATTTEFKYKVVATGTNGSERGRAGVAFDKAIVGSEFETSLAPTYAIKDGVLTITNANDMGDTYTAQIKDQYGVTMLDTDFYLDGKKITKLTNVPAGRHIWELKNDDQSKAFYLTTTTGGVLTVTGPTETSVDTLAGLKVALDDAAANASADTITITDTMALDAYTFKIPEEDTLVIASGVTLTNAAGTVMDIDGTLVINGIWDDTGINEGNIQLAGTVTGNGHWTNTTAITDEEGAVIILNGTTWEIAHTGNAFVNGTDVKVGGNVLLNTNGAALNLAAGTADADLSVEVKAGTTGTVVLPESSTITLTTKGGIYAIETDKIATATANIDAAGLTTVSSATGDTLVTDLATGQQQVVEDGKTAGPTMATMTTPLAKYTLGPCDVTTIPQSITIADPEYDATDVNNVTYTYKVTGTLTYDDAVSTALGFGGDFHWFFGLDTVSVKESGAGAVTGGLFASVNAAKTGLASITTDLIDGTKTETTFAEFVKGFSQSGTAEYTGNKVYAIKYTVGTKTFTHIYDLTKVTFAAKVTAES